MHPGQEDPHMCQAQFNFQDYSNFVIRSLQPHLEGASLEGIGSSW